MPGSPNEGEDGSEGVEFERGRVLTIEGRLGDKEMGGTAKIKLNRKGEQQKEENGAEKKVKVFF